MISTEFDTLKKLLGIANEQTEADGILNANLEYILDSTETRLKNLLGGIDPPDELRHIIIDVACIRFNRIGSEGTASHSVRDESISFVDDDFSGYMSEISAWLQAQDDTKTNKGKIRFM